MSFFDDEPVIKPKRGRKFKKLCHDQEQIIKEGLFSCASAQSASTLKYYSPIERERFENKFSQPKNIAQEKLAAYLADPSKKIVIAQGSAGTGKSLLCMEAAIRAFLLGDIEKIIVCRPLVSAGEDLGYLPGTIQEKMAPWIRPLYDIFHTHISPKEVEQLLADEIIEIAPIGFMRGRTFKNTIIVADECQNCTKSQMMMLLTRIGENARLFITGDLEQCDLKDPRSNGLEDFLSKFKNRRSDSISSVEFGVADIEREEVVKEVLEIYASSTIVLNEDEKVDL